MKLTSIALTSLMVSISALAQPPLTNAPNQKSSISLQEMLISGPPQLKMHSLSLIIQGQVKGEIDDSYLPGLKACAEDNSAAIRSFAARLLGVHFIQNKETPNAEALSTLEKLAYDPSDDVRFNAVYHGLSQIETITPQHAELLIDLAAKEQKPILKDRIIVALANYQPQVEEILNKKLQGNNAMAYFEIYEEFTGKAPENSEKFLNMPSSRPRMFVIKAKQGGASASAKRKLTKALAQAGIKDPTISISGTGENYVLMLTTYIAKDYLTAKKFLGNAPDYGVVQDMLLTPELEVQLESMRPEK
ncbi:HEAT repeat domain-containing protein [Pontiellaceae bacterium B12227]|nr:HEAT repeat domain-containing protein [Pontiellaceae bacterium B12227]